MKVLKIDYGILVPLCALRSYVLFVLINGLPIYLTSNGEEDLASGFMIALIIVILGPINTVTVLVMNLLKINQRFLLDWRYSILEVIIYQCSFYACESVYPNALGTLEIVMLYTSLIFGPIIITMSAGYLLKKYRKYLRWRKFIRLFKN